MFLSMDRTSEQVRSLSFIDELSGTRNRRGFFLLAERRLDEARENPASQLTVVLATVQGLKEANDWHGRPAGTELIRDAARVLTAAFGPDDVIARLGGGEFAVLSLGQPEDARERIAAAVEGRNEMTTERPYDLGLSVGIANRVVTDGLTIDELIAAADHDLHQHHGAAPAGPPPVRTTKPRAKRNSSDKRASRSAAA
jgi:diguanylate cyclase (GGDEF)-like protein